MKTIQLLLFGLILLATKAYGQKSCKYSSSSGFSGESFKLLDSNNFSYKYFSCIQRIEGQGKYMKTKRKIKLYFEKASSVFKADSIENKYSDSIYLWFSIKDMQTKIVSYGIIYLLDSSLKKIKATSTDSNGNAKLSIKKNNNIRYVKVDAFGYKKLIIPINSNNLNYMFEVNLNEKNASVPDSWEIFTYKIGNQTGDKIKLKRNGSKYLKYTVNCKS